MALTPFPCTVSYSAVDIPLLLLPQPCAL